MKRYVCVMNMCVHVHMLTVCMQRPEDNSVKLLLFSLFTCVLKTKLSLSGLHDKYLLSCLNSPSFSLIKLQYSLKHFFIRRNGSLKSFVLKHCNCLKGHDDLLFGGTTIFKILAKAVIGTKYN